MLSQEVESFISEFNDPPSVYVYFLRKRRNWSVILYRRVQQKNRRVTRIFHSPEKIYEFVEDVCKRGCELRTELPPRPVSCA